MEEEEDEEAEEEEEEDEGKVENLLEFFEQFMMSIYLHYLRKHDAKTQNP